MVFELSANCFGTSAVDPAKSVGKWFQGILFAVWRAAGCGCVYLCRPAHQVQAAGKSRKLEDRLPFFFAADDSLTRELVMIDSMGRHVFLPWAG